MSGQGLAEYGIALAVIGVIAAAATVLSRHADEGRRD
jgi:hypothetical protein